MTRTTYTQLRDKLASVLDRVTAGQEVIIIRRKGYRDVALIPADELSAIMETAHLLRSPKNARRLLRVFGRAGKGTSKPGAPPQATPRDENLVEALNGTQSSSLSSDPTCVAA